jgi:predicted negative regulator of RcsB-dependent stress response
MTKTGEAARPPIALDEPESGVELLQRYQRPIGIAAIVLAVAAGGVWMAKRSGEIKEQRASQAVAAAEGAYNEGGPAAAQPELAKVIVRYAGTNAGTTAAMLSAQWHYEIEQADSGLAVIATVMSKAPRHLRPGLLALQATGKSIKGDHTGAATDFRAAASAARFPADKDGYQMEAARSLMSAGDAAGAATIYAEIAAREDSPFAGEARLRLGEAKAKA